MAFLPAITGWMREAPGPRAVLHKSVTGRDGDRRRLTFTLTRELVEQVGWQGGERFVVSIGVGEDLGAFQLSRADHPRSGIKLIPHSRARGFRLHLNLPPVVHGVNVVAMLEAVPQACPCRFEAQDGVLVLRVEARIPVEAGGSVVPIRAGLAAS
ncbi:hypothetical protein [uncultured Pleomorphomonas sp.]|nr:hypothetical protein [uncultured Pleomorphomonas sp.]